MCAIITKHKIKWVSFYESVIKVTIFKYYQNVNILGGGAQTFTILKSRYVIHAYILIHTGIYDVVPRTNILVHMPMYCL